jgi:hypothetical protein
MRTLAFKLPSTTATGALTVDRIWYRVIGPVATPIPSKHHRNPDGVSKVAIEATLPSPTTPGCKFVA